MSRKLAGVLLDCDGIFYDNTVWQRWLLRLLAHLGLHTHYRLFFHLWQRDYLDDVYRSRRDFTDAFCAFLAECGLSRGQIDEVEAASRSRRRVFDADLRLLPGVKNTLDRLRRAGLTLGVVTNSEHPAAEIEDRFRRLGIGPMIAAVVSSRDVGRVLPDPAAYMAALAAMKTPVEGTAFVGHGTAELAGATAMGMRTIAVNFEPDARADVYLKRFDELPDWLDAPRPLAAAG